jgi:hypothetical protein
MAPMLGSGRHAGERPPHRGANVPESTRERKNAVHPARIHLDQLTELVRLLPFLIAIVAFLAGQGKRGKRRAAPPPNRRMSDATSPAAKQQAYRAPSAAKRDEPSIWTKDYDKEDQWGLGKEEWGDAFDDKWKSVFDDPAPPQRR